MESIPPFAIIVGAITAMGGLQYLVHGAAYDKPRAIGLDAFDRLVKARDERRRAAVDPSARDGRGWERWRRRRGSDDSTNEREEASWECV